jgi:uncharacterized cysteine cluster protein YcgN (CxxCxxCC family)
MSSTRDHPVAQAPFWKRKTLAQMTRAEWESLCDGCGRCCLIKIEEEDTGKLHLTSVACKLLDTKSCACRDYPNRQAQVPDCIAITPAKVAELPWLPPTCAYRLVAEGRSLPWWHPLVSGDPATVHAAGVSVRGFATSERRVRATDIERYIVPGYHKPRKKGEIVSDRNKD